VIKIEVKNKIYKLNLSWIIDFVKSAILFENMDILSSCYFVFIKFTIKHPSSSVKPVIQFRFNLLFNNLFFLINTFISLLY